MNMHCDDVAHGCLKKTAKKDWSWGDVVWSFNDGWSSGRVGIGVRKLLLSSSRRGIRKTSHIVESLPTSRVRTRSGAGGFAALEEVLIDAIMPGTMM